MATPFIGYWRDGKTLVMDRNAVLPDRCVKCNEAAEGYRRKLTFQHVSNTAHFAFGAFAYAMAKRATIEVPLCQRHRRTSAMTVGLVSLAVLILSFAVLSQPGQTSIPLLLLAVAGLIGGVVGLLKALFGMRLLRATKVTDTHLWLRGVGDAFLDAAPTTPTLAPDATLPTLDATAVAMNEPADVAQRAYRAVRAGALTFAIGALITAGTYVFLSGTYFLAWGPMAFGLFRLATGARAYFAVPAALRTVGQFATLGGLLALGVVAGGWVALEEYESDQFATALEKAAVPHESGSKLFVEVMNRNGAWTATDSADMLVVAASYAQAADILATANPPTTVSWYRDGLVKNFREAVDISTALSKQTQSSSQSSFDALIQRWTARIREFNDLQSRLDSQVK